MDKILREDGFKIVNKDLDTNEECNTSGYVSYVKKIDSGLINVDINTSVSGISIEFERDLFLNGTQKISFNKSIINTLNINYTFIVMCINLYNNIKGMEEAKVKIRDYIDLYVIINKYMVIINWDYIECLMKKIM